jgi:hypothetical protein
MSSLARNLADPLDGIQPQVHEDPGDVGDQRRQLFHPASVVRLDFGEAFSEIHQLSQQVPVFLGLDAMPEHLGESHFLDLQVPLLLL